jgi:hypothetical protein
LRTAPIIPLAAVSVLGNDAGDAVGRDVRAIAGSDLAATEEGGVAGEGIKESAEHEPGVET